MPDRKRHVQIAELAQLYKITTTLYFDTIAMYFLFSFASGVEELERKSFER